MVACNVVVVAATVVITCVVALLSVSELVLIEAVDFAEIVEASEPSLLVDVMLLSDSVFTAVDDVSMEAVSL